MAQDVKCPYCDKTSKAGIVVIHIKREHPEHLEEYRTAHPPKYPIRKKKVKPAVQQQTQVQAPPEPPKPPAQEPPKEVVKEAPKPKQPKPTPKPAETQVPVKESGDEAKPKGKSFLGSIFEGTRFD